MTAVREYSNEDIQSVRDLWCQLVDRHRTIYESEGIGGDNPAAQFDEYLTNPRLLGLWVAEETGNVVGMVGLLMGPAGEAEIEPIVVHSDWRSKGIGLQLLQRAKAEAINRGIKSLNTKPAARNAAAMRFFHKAGFTTLGQVELFQSLAPDKNLWKRGIAIHGDDYEY